MPTPFASRQSAVSIQSADPKPKPTILNPEWRCKRCDKLLGICRDGRMHLRFGRGHEYFASFPVEAVCRGCKTRNRTSGPKG